MKRASGILVLGVALLAGCGSTSPIASRNDFTGVYGSPSGELHLLARVHHSAPDQSAILFKLRTNELLYKSATGGAPYQARVRITYEAYADWDSNALLDSASTLVGDRSDNPEEVKDLIGTMEMRRNDRRSFILKVTARDLNREIEDVMTIAVDRDGPGTRQNFLPMSATTGRPLFDDHFAAGTPLRIRCEQYAGRKLDVTYYHEADKLPSPVFTFGTTPTPLPQPDSSFTVTVDSTGAFDFTTLREGFCHFRPDTASLNGYTVFTLGDTYPDVHSAKAMLPPLRYITSMQEFDAMTTATEQRKAIERFWLDAAGDRDRARDAIRAYYKRVENANRHFTSSVEGWKTDRGLVHIIFGTPNTVHKSAQSETWIYGEETNLMSLSFTFTKREGPFTGNDLVLERDPVYKAAWYRNVESWRNGRTYQN